MATATNHVRASNFLNSLDGLFFEVCDEVQLNETRHSLATQRYMAVGTLLESESSPFKMLRPRIFPQGSMALGTTVKPIEGPHDLDFVLELAASHTSVDPMALIKCLFGFLKSNGVYAAMTELKNRCVRLVYADDFYMDILPACRDEQSGGTCLRVPDRRLEGWKPSNPQGYIQWFLGRSPVLRRRLILADAAPVPALQATEDKYPLQLAVQLIKRWRDLHYVDKCDVAPISIVLTTLAGRNYRGEGSVSEALGSILGGIQEEISFATSRGTRVFVSNPSNDDEDLSERWSGNVASYRAFVEGISDFVAKWSEVLRKGGNVAVELEDLFGEPVSRAYEKQARRLQEERRKGLLSVSPTGLIKGVTTSSPPIRSNTFYGED